MKDTVVAKNRELKVYISQVIHSIKETNTRKP